MCWSGEASACFALVGIATAVRAAYKKEPACLWMTLGYFALMEALQTFQYKVIGQCDDPTNQVLTLIGYLHISCQPFFFNAVALHFIPENVKNKIQYFVYAICFIVSMSLWIKIYPFEWAGKCTPGVSMCGTKLCSDFADWHIGWHIPMNGLFENIIPIGFLTTTYVFASIALPFIYGSWRFALYHALLGPMMFSSYAKTTNEQGAIWCLLSVAIWFIVVTPLRKILVVKKLWYSRLISK